MMNRLTCGIAACDNGRFVQSGTGMTVNCAKMGVSVALIRRDKAIGIKIR